MENRIPLPTDNIYKFYALFGLLLFTFGVGGLIYLTKATNEFIAKAAVEHAVIRATQHPTVAERVRGDILAAQIDVATSDRKFFRICLSWLAGLAFWLSAYGFFVWHRHIQPMQDELLRLQVQASRSTSAKSTGVRRLRRHA